jgi:catechol 2,3-dioxygenase-like lactoylglutathione lyase family enzyme
VSDRARSAEFYARHFGLTERIHEDDHLLILGSGGGGTLLALSEGTPPAGTLPRTNHFGFQLDSGDAVRTARGRFRDAGLKETEWQDDGNFVRVQVVDPDGYLVELYSY